MATTKKLATTNKRKPRRKPRTLKQIATKLMRSAEDEAQKLIHGVTALQKKSKSRVQKRARTKAVRARTRTRARGGARAHAS